MTERKRSLVDELTTYANRSADGLGRMRDSAQKAMRSVKTPLDGYAKDIQDLLPMAGTLEGIRLGREAYGLWDKGDYGNSLDKYADALDAPMADVLWFAPGAGFIRKIK